MNTTDLMKDPFYAAILLQIETTILAADKKAATQGIALTDSQVRSVVHRARKADEGAPKQITSKSARDSILVELHIDLLSIPNRLFVTGPATPTKPLSTDDWTLSLRAVEDSIRLRSTGAGSRSYLNFLPGFLSQIK